MTRSPFHAACLGFLLALTVFGGCTSSPKTVGGASPSAPDEDVFYLSNREVVRGKIVGEDQYRVAIQKPDGRTTVVQQNMITAADFSADSYKARTAPPMQPPDPARPANAKPTTNWIPCSDPQAAPEKAILVDWKASHEWPRCTGERLAKAHENFPEVRLFLPPSGKMVVYDRRNFGFHAHVMPKGFYAPSDQAGLSIPIPEKEGEMPEAIALVSDAGEFKATEGGKERKSFVLGDVFYAGLRPLSQAQATLAVQPFAGGKPQEGAKGPLWAFGLTRSQNQWILYVLDGPERKNAKNLKSSYPACGDTILNADLIVDVEAPDGDVVGRVFVLPYPDDTPAAGDLPVTLYTGPRHDPTALATVKLPPRQELVLPPKPPGTKADVWIHAFEVTKDLPQSLVVAWGTGNPSSSAVTTSGRELTPDKADEKVTIDLAGRAEDEFPAVAWLYSRRTMAWRTAGGFKPPVPELNVPASQPRPLTRVKVSPPIPHCLPIYFTGPKPLAIKNGDPAVAGMGSGLTNAVMQDALARQAGNIPNLTSNLGTNLGASPTYSNTTYVNVSVPPHTASPLSGSTYTPPPSGRYWSGTPGPAETIFAGDAKSTMGGWYDQSTGVYRNNQGQKVWDPSDPSSKWYPSNSGGQNGSQLSVSIPAGAAPGGPSVVVPLNEQRR